MLTMIHNNLLNDVLYSWEFFIQKSPSHQNEKSIYALHVLA